MGVYYGFMQPSYLWHFQERSLLISSHSAWRNGMGKPGRLVITCMAQWARP